MSIDPLIPIWNHPKVHSSVGQQTGTPAQPEVAVVYLESKWQARLRSKGWSDETASIIPSALAPSPLQTYNRSLQKLQSFCLSRRQTFPPECEHVLVDFILSIPKGSNRRPKATLKVTHAALSALYEARGQVIPVNVQDLHTSLMTAVKLCTTDAVERSSVMPVETLKQLFASWGINSELSVRQLRMKAVTLLTLTALGAVPLTWLLKPPI